MNNKDQLTHEVGENRYLINALDASFGLEAMNKLADFATAGTNPSASFIKGVVLASVTYNNKAVNEKWFDKHFSRNYKELNELFAKILEFNFGDMGADGVPNEQSDTSE